MYVQLTPKFGRDLRWHKRIGFLTLLLSALAAGNAQAGHWQLIDTYAVDVDRKYPVSWAISENLYNINVSFKRRYKSDRCIGDYSVAYSFSRPIGQLIEDEPFSAKVIKVTGKSPCGHKWTKARLRGSDNNPKGASKFPADLETNGNIMVTSYEGDWNNSGAILLYEGTPAGMEVHFLPKMRKDLRYSTMTLSAGDNVFYLLYEYVGNGRTKTPIQKSSFGNIDWDNGFYGNTTKTIKIDRRIQGLGGEFTLIGQWGRTNSTDHGYFEFHYTDECTFTGQYWRDSGAKKSWKGWCG